MHTRPSSGTRRARRRTGLTRSRRVALGAVFVLILIGAALVDLQFRGVANALAETDATTAASIASARNFMYGVVALVMVGVAVVGATVIKPAAETARDALEDLRQANADLDDALEAARDAARAKSEFVATMSHELRTPLNAVIGLSSLLVDTPLQPRQAMYVSTINRSGEALLGLINNVLDVSKIEAGKLELEFVDFDLRDLVEQTAETMALRAEAQNLDLATIVAADVPVTVRGDLGRLRQVLLNLLGNAIKFTQSGSVSIQVSKVPNGMVRLAVVDTGIGIPADRINRLFKAFSQVDASTTRRFGGTGLGLDISRRIVDLMRGTIGVTSEEGVGSTFFVEIPLDEIDVARTTELIALTQKRVLVVDDAEVVRRAVSDGIVALGAAVVEASNGNDALRRLRDAAAAGTAFDVAIVDWSLPDQDGATWAATLRADPVVGNTPVILLSSFANPMDAASAGRLRISATIPKPVRVRALHAALGGLTAGPKLAASDAPTLRVGTALPQWPGRRVLAADDNPVNIMVLKAMLDLHGVGADVAVDGNAVLEILKRSTYDLLLLDVHMPGMDGVTAATAIRQGEASAGSARLPIVALTASVTQDDRDACERAGMDDYVSKPIARDVLMQTLRRWLGEPDHESAGAPIM